MQYISFYKDRLPFKPKSNVVIYFDVMGVGQKYHYRIINEHYEDIVATFRRGGLEFCFLPRIAHDMDLIKIYYYFNPQASENDPFPHFPVNDASYLLEYIVVDFDKRRLSPGLIQYMGEHFDKEDTYTFSYTPIPTRINYSAPSSTLLLHRYLEEYVFQHGARDALFESCHTQSPREFPEEEATLGISYKQDSREITQEDDVDLMMSEVQMLVERLRRSGVGEMALQLLFKPTQKLSHLHVRYGRIFLPDYNNMEIKMPPLSKAIFMLYLRHPEGIMFSYLPDYRDELLHLYGLISGRDNREDIRRSIDDVTDPTRNSINEKCSRIKQAFLREFDDSIARNYYITGERGEVKKILLPRDMVTWEMPEIS